MIIKKNKFDFDSRYFSIMFGTYKSEFNCKRKLFYFDVRIIICSKIFCCQLNETEFKNRETYIKRHKKSKFWDGYMIIFNYFNLSLGYHNINIALNGEDKNGNN